MKLIFAALLLAIPSGLVAESVPCATGVEVIISTTSPVQGKLTTVELRSATPLADIKGGWSGQTLHFWTSDIESHVYRALLGVDLVKKPGSYPLAISMTNRDGEPIVCSIPLSVLEGDFVVEKLRVDRQYVELSQEDLERARREGRRLRKIWDTVTPERLWQGDFRYPIPGAKGSRNFGKRRVFNDEPRSPHSGEDFSSPTGTPIRSPQRGRVVLAEEQFFSGNAVVVDHGLGLYTFHGHMSAIAVEVGQMVEVGQILGKVGATGRVTGPHLHWTVRLGRARVNPRDLFELTQSAPVQEDPH